MSERPISPQAVRFDRVTARYREVTALAEISFTVPAGEILALLGPSGCGKSTLLRAIAGFVPHSGDIYVGDRSTAGVPSHRRNIGMVFQDYALFPHMTVADNVGFGLKMRRVPRSAIGTLVSEALGLVGLADFESRMARQLSGGQQQRVALARALVIKPAILLLDEPLSALDKKLREEMRFELKRIQRLTGVTTIFVTHDQDEALGLADRLALMRRGTVLQIGRPEDVYRRPATPFVAEFLGAVNSRKAICRSADAASSLLEVPGLGFLRAATSPAPIQVGDEARLFVRPERIALVRHGTHDTQCALSATVTAQIYLGRHKEVTLRLADGTNWTANISDEATDTGIGVGSEVTVVVEPRDVLAFAERDFERTLQ